MNAYMNLDVIIFYTIPFKLYRLLAPAHDQNCDTICVWTGVRSTVFLLYVLSVMLYHIYCTLFIPFFFFVNEIEVDAVNAQYQFNANIHAREREREPVDEVSVKNHFNCIVLFLFNVHTNYICLGIISIRAVCACIFCSCFLCCSLSMSLILDYHTYSVDAMQLKYRHAK